MSTRAPNPHAVRNRWILAGVVGAVFALSYLGAEPTTSTDSHKQPEMLTVATSPDVTPEQQAAIRAAKIEELANVAGWYDPEDAKMRVSKKALGKLAPQYKQMASAAAYVVAASTGKQVTVGALSILDVKPGKPDLLIITESGKESKDAGVSSYDIPYTALRDSNGQWYTAATADQYEADHGKLKSRAQLKQEAYAAAVLKAPDLGASVTTAQKIVKRNLNHPSSADFDWGIDERGIDDDGTRYFSIGFTAKNSFNLETHHRATFKATPKGVVTLLSMVED